MDLAENWSAVQSWLRTLPAGRAKRSVTPRSCGAHTETAIDPRARRPKLTARRAFALIVDTIQDELPELAADIVRNAAKSVMRALGMATPPEPKTPIATVSSVTPDLHPA